ncbi:MAG: tRNA dihydrouridine synthase DusB [Phycisphaeraceae bacterium]|nr:tRNA dihydrouridine synthase DusB [Phycisphaeraceae bacterium]
MLRIGPVQLQTNLLLAPIAGYCDLAYRLICRSFGGVGLACTDLLSPQGLLRGTATSLDLARTNDLDKPVGMQLYGCDPAIMAQGARWAADHGATVIDINMGCPVDKVTKKDGGSKLLCDPDRAQRLVEAIAAEVARDNIPVTAKLRLGWFNDHPVAEWLAPRLVQSGAAAITIHGRTTEQKFAGEVSHAGIARVVQAVKAVSPNTPVIGNGDVREAQDVQVMLDRTGCDGVMIGRGALSTPWLFRDAWSLLSGRGLPPTPSESEKIETIRRYFVMMLEFRHEHYAMTQVRRRISWFAKRLGPCKPLREAIRLARGPDDIHAALDLFAAGGLRRFSGDLAGAEEETLDPAPA